MDGNYKAENVYFSENLITTTDIGSIKIENDKPFEIYSKGKTIK
jgi:hypothetical protein